MRLDSSKSHKGLFFIVGATALIAVAVYAINRMPISFEKSRWLQAGENGDWRVRTSMAKDLIASGRVIGKTRDELVTILGQPEEYTDTKKNQMFYLIREDWSGIDPVRRDHLLITIDQNGRAVSAVIDVFKR